MLDKCEGSGLFGCIPIGSWNETWVQGFGPTNYAWEACHDIMNFVPEGKKYGEGGGKKGVGGCPYSNLRGLHNGLDFPAPNGSALVWAGVNNGKVKTTVGSDGYPAIFIDYAGAIVVYGHRKPGEYGVFVKSGDEVRPGQTIALSDKNHSHFGLRSSSGWFMNPLYFFTPNLQSRIVSAIGPSAYPATYKGRPVNWGPYSMVAFRPWGIHVDECGIYDDTTNFWREGANTAEITWSPGSY